MVGFGFLYFDLLLPYAQRLTSLLHLVQIEFYFLGQFSSLSHLRHFQSSMRSSYNDFPAKE